ncbi:molybdopterin molybdotransferase [Pseudoduganella lurida]|uniref:Molybdenum cofactor guanylyltransferase n=1 Tax=Pseudoduganella lurida TaxID=1036180 RepID=A0A562R665_9BURK|nr:gephyrin-like molybdotransferase Glp [Pseudoduganella lurida]TWI64555.1 molybdopterin molybdotransferase [Pseudoduganella lurida]
MTDTISGLLLAGGRGTRMGGVDKGLQPFRGGTLAGHVLQRFTPQVAHVTISANRSTAHYAALGVPVLADELAGYEGPLAGLQTALRHADTPLLATVPCDSPFLPDDLVAKLHAALLAQDADIAIAVTLEADATGAARKQSHPVFALMKRAVLPQLESYLAEGGRRMDGWHGALKVAEVLFTDAGAFRNINTPDELRDAEGTRATLRQVAAAHAGYDPHAVPVRQARQIISDFVQPVRGTEKVALRAALGRVLAGDIVSPISVPAHDNSAMDGFAFGGAQLSTEHPTTLRVIGTVYAGRPSALQPAAGEAVRIMTGAVMPAGCDTVLAQEHAAGITEDSVTVAPRSVRAGDNRRLAGEDLMAGRAALAAGRIVRPADLGLIASLGIAEVAVRRRLRVAFFSTGDELRSIGEPLGQGSVYDSNRYTLFGMLTRLGCEIVDMGIVRDDPAALEAALCDACESADAIITSGGVSAGAADYTRDIMARLGEVAFWTIGMRPGRPMAFGRIGARSDTQHDTGSGREAFLFGLPGNPVAVMVSFYFFARPALLRMMGASVPDDLLVQARAAGAIRKRPGRTEFQRGILEVAPDGSRTVRITGAQGSGILRSMTKANCIVVLPDEQGNVAAGDTVEVLLFEGLV